MNSMNFSDPVFTKPPQPGSFYPYADNGGSSLGIAGVDYCVIASDTRHSESFHINTRYAPKTFRLADKAALTVCGFCADANSMVKRITNRMEWYKHAYDKEMATPSIAQLLSITLYSKRFFPYYVSTILGGFDSKGRGILYNYDVIGSFEPVASRAVGTAADLIQPLLDNQVKPLSKEEYFRTALPLDRAVALAKDAFTSAVERDIHTGDFLEVHVITKDGTTVEKIDLKKD